MRICVLDDDLSQTEFVAQTLTAAGHLCQVFMDGKSLIHELRRQPYDLLLLDWNMPEMPGDVVLQWVRKNLTTNLPVLFLTSRSVEADIVQMLNAGADDYILKPVSRPVLLARVEALLRRIYMQQHEATQETYGIYRFDLTTQTALVSEAPATLTQKEFELALLLFRNLSRPLSRSHIRESVWRQDVDIPSRTIDTHVSQIRSKLVLRPQNGYRITPIYSYGYRLEKVGNESP
ncbi:response regulator transcription factor [Caballeronia sp. SEWSISQ10-4 2]|uniref:response regulator transcription factor n=1 Tax=Caballeronia sp. SEWSISQ10-4 2 TaxID=2937438 RepID=UPI00264AC525|nr:response regulator transcription factor [Caballeronia sp. SEWSISQ10-4 2]MDN7182359.1 response regulator transcription factor [Caballeronia sp. SEWSISQ10-4 2]